MSRLCLYDIQEPEYDRWLPGDRFIRPIVRRTVRGPRRPSGLDRVLLNLRLGLDQLGLSYEVNLPFQKLRDDDHVCVLGRGVHCLDGYNRPNRIMGGIGMMTHPAEWPDLCDRHPVVRYLQHCEWGRRMYAAYYGQHRVSCWAVGIDADAWQPVPPKAKTTDFLIYDKIRWNRDHYEVQLLNPILEALRARGLTWEVLRYNSYAPEAYRSVFSFSKDLYRRRFVSGRGFDTYRLALNRCRAMLFLCENESQGLAYQEAMASGLPVLAWDQGWWLDPNRFKWNADPTPATSVPFFDARCGRRFRDFAAFPAELDLFLTQLRQGNFDPRGYVVETLPLHQCAAHFVQLANEVLS